MRARLLGLAALATLGIAACGGASGGDELNAERDYDDIEPDAISDAGTIAIDITDR